MMLVEETTVPAGALPVEAFKRHLRLGTGFGDDGLQDAVLESFLRAALAAVEARTGKVLIERDFSWSVTKWRMVCEQPLPVAPVNELLLVTRIDADEVSTAVEPDAYRLVQDPHRPLLVSVGLGLPSIPVNGRIEVRFRAGYATEWADLPADLAQAVLLLAAHYYEYRQETGLGEGCMPFGVTALLQRYRPMRVSVGGA
ncbi:head-tail connector protein [Pseudaestuariivita rosea]|uniref:head-tail connector protein n=1 Tax=Pseudaestuariivita rosea TaxID=2763263 RepID=UPI001ABA723D|nr:head-tail connector protein [Pseudaestuariivita rosea]